MHQPVLIFVGAALGLALAKWIFDVLTDPLKSVPGPTLARFTKLWLGRQYWVGNYTKTNINLHRRYGAVVRIAPGQYSVDDPSAASILYGLSNPMAKSSWYRPFSNPYYTNLFNVESPQVHGLERRKFASAYAMTSLVAYEPYVDECVQKFNARLSEFAKTAATIDVQRWTQFFAFDTISMITFSKPLGFLEKGVDVSGFIASIDDLNWFSPIGGIAPNFFINILKVLQNLPAIRPKGFNIVQDFIERQLKLYRSGEMETTEDGPMDFVTHMFRSGKKEGGNIGEQEARVAAVQNMLAGSDTTSISLTGILGHLYRHPDVLAKLRKELDDAIPADERNRPSPYKRVQSLPYMQAVIKEGMRCHPALGVTLPRVIPQGGKHLAGQFFPAGSVVGINPWVAHFNQDVFGPDAKEFRPERWLGEGSKKSMDGYLLSFGMGSRACIGRNISLLEITKLLPIIVQNYDLAIETEDPLNFDLAFFAKPLNFKGRLLPRKA